MTIDFVVLPDRSQLTAVIQQVREGRLRPNIATIATLDDAVAALYPTRWVSGETIIQVRQKR